MSTNRALFPIAAMARVLGVSTAGYYAWRDRPPSAHTQADAALLTRVRTIHATSRQLYGAPRVQAQLRADGHRHGGKRIASLMRDAGLVGACHRGSGTTTTRRDQDARPAPDLVNRKFTAEGPNQLWVADITFVPRWRTGCDPVAAQAHQPSTKAGQSQSQVRDLRAFKSSQIQMGMQYDDALYFNGDGYPVLELDRLGALKHSSLRHRPGREHDLAQGTPATRAVQPSLRLPVRSRGTLGVAYTLHWAFF